MSETKTTPKLKEIAERINAHLKRFEADPEINARPKREGDNRGMGILPYWCSGANAVGRYISIRYVSFQGGSNLTKDEATRYLAWLDAGNVGQHYAALRLQ